jgi:hypothetical protein
MRTKPITVNALEDQEVVAQKIAKYNLLAVPVLEKDGSVVGFVTVDDVIDVLVEEGTEDFLRMAAVEPGALDRPYMQVSLPLMIRKRAGWLVILFLGEMLTATAMGFFEKEIAKAVVLALFVPLIISSGGNSGSQASTLVIRALALSEVKLSDWWRVMRREVLSGIGDWSDSWFDRFPSHHNLVVLLESIWPALDVGGNDSGHCIDWYSSVGNAGGLDVAIFAAQTRLRSGHIFGSIRRNPGDVTGLVIYFSVAVSC